MSDNRRLEQISFDGDSVYICPYCCYILGSIADPEVDKITICPECGGKL